MKTISQFNVMKPEAPEYSDANHIYSMYGVDPLYYVYDGTQEKQLSPCAASVASIVATPGITGNIVQMIPAGVSRRSTSARADVFFVTDTGNVYSYSNTYGLITMGVMFGSIFDKTYRIAVGANGYLVGTIGQSNSIYVNALSQGGVLFPDSISTTWTQKTPGDYYQSIAGVQIEPFQNYVGVISRASSGNLTASRVQLYPYNNNFTAGSTAKIDLGDGWQILRLVNYQNTYLAIGAYYSSNQLGFGGLGTAPDSSVSYVFFWNGQATSTARYQFSVQVPGTLLDLCYSENKLYALTLDRNNNYALYVYTGRSFKKVFNINFDTPNLYTGSGLFAYPNGIGINLQNKGAYIVTENNGKEYKFVPTTTGSTNCFCVSTSGVLYGGTSTGGLLYQPTYAAVGYNDIDVTTHWIPLATKLSSINVWYESLPTTTGEYIRITASSWGEDQADGVNTQVLSDITSTQFDTKVKTTLDLKGLTGTMLKLRIQTHSVGSWRPIIRKIEGNEDK